MSAAAASQSMIERVETGMVRPSRVQSASRRSSPVRTRPPVISATCVSSAALSSSALNSSAKGLEMAAWALPSSTPPSTLASGAANRIERTYDPLWSVVTEPW